MHPAHSYANPVYSRYLADPFVWHHKNVFYAVGTGPGEAAGQAPGDSRAIPLLRSDDLISWQFLHLALIRPPMELGDEIWAPEVAFHDGTFYLYYSVGHGDKNHQLRVATSDRPEGPYRDTGFLTELAHCPFAIDPHPFRDDDGQWYLFYARDFLDTDTQVRAGTALAMDRLIDMTRLAGEERVVMRARHDWQRYKAHRLMYGRYFDWHTLEGPTVRKHDGKYYCLYSGGCWDSDNYGVDYVIAHRITGPYMDTNRTPGPRVLRTIPQKVLGPGHNSIVSPGDGGGEWIVYHAWDVEKGARRMCIDPLTWTDDGPRSPGPTWTPQSAAPLSLEGRYA